MVKLFVIFVIFYVHTDGSQFHNLCPSSRIIGDTKISIEDTPWLVSIQKYSNHHCGGSIISKNWILTAASCIELYVSSYSIRAGSTYYNSRGIIRSINNTIIHEGFKTNEYGFSENNIALIQVNESLTFNETIKPVKLINIDEVLASDSNVNVSGWGDFIAVPKHLRSDQSTVLDKIFCWNTYEKFNGFYENQSCIKSTSSSGTCPTDTGNPVTKLDDRLGGIVSWAQACGRIGYPKIVTDVGAYRFWIFRHTLVW